MPDEEERERRELDRAIATIARSRRGRRVESSTRHVRAHGYGAVAPMAAYLRAYEDGEKAATAAGSRRLVRLIAEIEGPDTWLTLFALLWHGTVEVDSAPVAQEAAVWTARLNAGVPGCPWYLSADLELVPDAECYAGGRRSLCTWTDALRGYARCPIHAAGAAQRARRHRSRLRRFLEVARRLRARVVLAFRRRP